LVVKQILSTESVHSLRLLQQHWLSDGLRGSQGNGNAQRVDGDIGIGAGLGPIEMTGALTVTDGMAMAGFGAISPILAGFLVLLLLLLSALIWACWKCKPGCCPPFIGAKAGGGGGLKRAAAICCAAPEKDILNRKVSADAVDAAEEKQASVEQLAKCLNELPALSWDSSPGPAEGNVECRALYLIVDIKKTQEPLLQATNGFYNKDTRIMGYGDGNQLDLSPGPRYDIDHQDFVGMGEDTQNVYMSDMKVETCIISQNSKYVVTGSATSPPQVWDMQSGDLCKIMSGYECAATNLHLGCNDTILVGQVLDDYDGYGYGSMKLYRLQLWDFAKGNQLEMPDDILCTTSCMTRIDQKNVIVARYSEQHGSSILVWDLIGNQVERELMYQPVKPELREEPVTFLDISHDDRLVVAGLYSPSEDVSYYMVFDFSMSYIVSVLLIRWASPSILVERARRLKPQ
ncbi:Neurexin-3-beta, partial [Cichlidogyrus casuarinus]